VYVGLRRLRRSTLARRLGRLVLQRLTPVEVGGSSACSATGPIATVWTPRGDFVTSPLSDVRAWGIGPGSHTGGKWIELKRQF
jgi:hypothetical protein